MTAALDANVSIIYDADSVTGWITRIKAAYGQTVPLAFASISYAGQTPTSSAGITWKLLVKAARDDEEADALVNATNAALTLTSAPLTLSYLLDTSAVGFARGTTYYGELWADDATYGKHLIHEFTCVLNDPIRRVYD